MPKKTSSYRDWLTSKLSDPRRAARYLTAAAEDSEAMFLKALRKVASAQSRSMKELAEICGVSRESLYRMLSETGNPTSGNRRAILASLGLKSIVVPVEVTVVLGSEPNAASGADHSFTHPSTAGGFSDATGGTLNASSFTPWSQVSNTFTSVVVGTALKTFAGAAAQAVPLKKPVSMEFYANNNAEAGTQR